MFRCPGQDQRFWKPEDIFEIPCTSCGKSVEFWKDEPQVKCPYCKQSIVNPKLDLGCATWCKHAEECLGQITGSRNQGLSHKLIESLREVAGSEPAILRLSLEILSYADPIQLKEGGDPLVVKAAAILSQLHKLPSIADEDIDHKRDQFIRDILEKLKINASLVDQISQILAAYQSGHRLDSLEFNILIDSVGLANLKQDLQAGKKSAGEMAWKTAAAKQLAEEIDNRNTSGTDS